MVEQANILFLNIFPEFSLLLQILLRAGADQHDRRDDCDDLQVVEHIMSELPVRNFPQVKRIDHNLIHTDLLINAGNHHSLIDGLIVSSDKIPVKIHIHIIERPHTRKRLVYIDVIHIEGVLRQFQSTLHQKLRAVDHGMHENILSLVKMSGFLPGKYPVFRKIGAAHDPLSHIHN